MLKLRNLCILRCGMKYHIQRPLPPLYGKSISDLIEARVGSTDMVPMYQNSNK